MSTCIILINIHTNKKNIIKALFTVSTLLLFIILYSSVMDTER